MLARKKCHRARQIRPHNRKSSDQEAKGSQSGTFQSLKDISTSSWKPNKSPSATQPDKKISGCMKKGRLESSSCLVRLFSLIPNLVVHRRSMRRSIHLLDGEILWG